MSVLNAVKHLNMYKIKGKWRCKITYRWNLIFVETKHSAAIMINVVRIYFIPNSEFNAYFKQIKIILSAVY